MAEGNVTGWRKLAADKQAIQQAVAQANLEAGFVPDSTATPRRAQEHMIALGIRPEDNLFSCGILSARDQE